MLCAGIGYGPVCLSVKRHYYVKTAAQIELQFFCVRVFLDLRYTVLCGNQDISQNKKGTFLWNFVTNSGLGKFGHDTFTVAECDVNKRQPSVYC